MFPSSLSANTVRVQSIFSRHYHVEPAPSSGGTRAAAQQAQKEQQTEPEAEKTDEQEVSFGRLTGSSSAGPVSSCQGRTDQTDRLSLAAHVQASKENRRATRSTHKGLPDEWLKIPMTARVKVVTGTFEELEGNVYLSLETGRKCPPPRTRITPTNPVLTGSLCVQVYLSNTARFTSRPPGRATTTSSSSPRESCPC